MTMLNVAVIGKSGQLGRALKTRYENTNHNVQFFGREQLELSSDNQAITAFLNQLSPVDVIIIAAAYTDVDRAQEEPDLANMVNAVAIGIIADFCKSTKTALVHISTDYVFDGTDTGYYCTDHQTSPLGVYGQSKLSGEAHILNADCNAVILRTSWVFDGTGKNFFTTMLRLGQTMETVNVVADQIGRPTFAGHLADAVIISANKLVQNGSSVSGIYHVSGSGEPASWADFAIEIFDAAQSDIPQLARVRKISTVDFPTKARRPKNSLLNLSRFEQTFEMELPNWREGLKEALSEWKAANIEVNP